MDKTSAVPTAASLTSEVKTPHRQVKTLTAEIKALKKEITQVKKRHVVTSTSTLTAKKARVAGQKRSLSKSRTMFWLRRTRSRKLLMLITTGNLTM